MSHISKAEKRRQLARAAELLAADYAPGGELRVFEELEGEDIYEYTEEDFANLKEFKPVKKLKLRDRKSVIEAASKLDNENKERVD